jgi:tRNA(Arg) A34 adenosine deaminase TadA
VKFSYHAPELATRAEAEGEVPVGALVILENQIISESRSNLQS